VHKCTGMTGARPSPHLQLTFKAEVLSISATTWLHTEQGSVLHSAWGAHGKPNRDGAALPPGHGALSSSHSPPSSVRCCRYARMSVSTGKRRCRAILALEHFVSARMQPDGSTGGDCKPQPVLGLHHCLLTLGVPTQLQNELQDQDVEGAQGVWPLGCHMRC